VRAGAVIKSLVTTMCGAAMLITAAAVLDPATLQAGSVAAPRIGEPHNAHQDLLNSLTSMLSQCRQVLAVRAGEEDRGAEMIMWLEDSHDPGRINADELAVVRHSPLFQTITLYNVARDTRSSQGARLTSRAASASPAEATLTQADLAAPGFIDRWRAMPAVAARVVGSGISDMNIEQVDRSNARELSLVRLHLTWAGDSADGPDDASAAVQVQGAFDAARAQQK
jgi:hypothetical protein